MPVWIEDPPELPPLRYRALRPPTPGFFVYAHPGIGRPLFLDPKLPPNPPRGWIYEGIVSPTGEFVIQEGSEPRPLLLDRVVRLIDAKGQVHIVREGDFHVAVYASKPAVPLTIQRKKVYQNRALEPKGVAFTAAEVRKLFRLRPRWGKTYTVLFATYAERPYEVLLENTVDRKKKASRRNPARSKGPPPPVGGPPVR